MKSDKGQKRGGILGTFFLSLVAFGISLFLFHCVMWAVYARRATSLNTLLTFRYEQLKWDREHPGAERWAPAFEPTAKEAGKFYFGDIKAYYYPEAWDKADSVLLRRRLGQLEHVVFGKGTYASLTYYSYRESDPNTSVGLIATTYGEPYVKYFFPTLVLAGLAIVLAMWLTTRRTVREFADQPPRNKRPESSETSNSQ